MAQPTGTKGFGARLAQERRLKAARDGRDILKGTAAKAIGVSNSTYGRWEDGTVPDDDAIEALAAYFGVTPSWLRYGQEPRQPPRKAPIDDGVIEDTPEPTPDHFLERLKKASGDAARPAPGIADASTPSALRGRRPRRSGGK